MVSVQMMMMTGANGRRHSGVDAYYTNVVWVYRTDVELSFPSSASF